jgi:exodeoxyribonuclease VII large subunit
LEAEGLFDAARKRPLPPYPRRIGVITSPTGAAIHDIIRITSRRYPLAELIVFPALVQGEGAAGSLTMGIELFSAVDLCDVIIIGRGGGSMEDLWCFNDEALAREIYACKTPIISAVGHEIDFTISDFVADLRAPTPSAAAELAVPDMVELGRKFGNVQDKMKNSLQNRVSVMSQRLQFLASRPVLTSPQAYFDDRKQQILSLEERLNRALVVSSDRKKQKLQLQAEKLHSLNPLAILDRGFSVALKEDGTILRTPEDVAVGEAFTLRMAKGEMQAVKTQEN